MLSHKTDGPLVVQMPDPRDDRPTWWRVGVIAAAGFAVGLLWPRVAGLRPTPSAPEASSASSVALPVAPAPPATSGIEATAAASLRPAPIPSPAPSSDLAAPVASDAHPAAEPEPAAAPAAAPTPPAAAKINVLSGPILSCKSEGGEQLKGADCGKLKGLDALVLSRLHKLAECPDAAAARGRMTLVLHLDFARGWLSADLGHTQTVAAPDPLLACARADLAGATLATVSRDNTRYSVVYSVVFESPDGAPEAASAATSRAPEPAEGTAQVVWEVAIVRDVPKTGKVLARLQRGTQVRVGPVKDGWYPVKYGDGDASDGWVYRGAIGR
jgi:hypothetical protein